MHHAKKTENFSPDKVNTCVSSILNNETGLCESEKKKMTKSYINSAYFEQVEINLLGVCIFFLVDTGEQILHIQYNPQ